MDYLGVIGYFLKRCISRMSKQAIFVSICFFVVCSLAVSLYAATSEVPRRINYQGILTDANKGVPKTGTFNFIVRI